MRFWPRAALRVELVALVPPRGCRFENDPGEHVAHRVLATPNRIYRVAPAFDHPSAHEVPRAVSPALEPQARGGLGHDADRDTRWAGAGEHTAVARSRSAAGTRLRNLPGTDAVAARDDRALARGVEADLVPAVRCALPLPPSPRVVAAPGVTLPGDRWVVAHSGSASGYRALSLSVQKHGQWRQGHLAAGDYR